MTRADLLSRVRQKPLRPFRIIVSRDAVTIGVAADPNQDYSDSTVMIDLFHVVRLEPLEATSTATGNGQ